MIKTRMATRQDAGKITEFIGNHWKRDHIFVKWPALLDWQHADDDSLNFVLAESGAEIMAILGFIPHRRYDAALTKNAIGLAIWKTVENAPPGLGVGLLKHLIRVERPSIVIAIGLSAQVVPLYAAMGFAVGQLKTFFLPNPSVSHSIGQNLPEPEWPSEARQVPHVVLSVPVLPHKSPAYLENRYAEHPVYEYDFVRCGTSERHLTLVLRRIVVGDSAIARIADYSGEPRLLPLATEGLLELIAKHRLEYVDFVQHGFPTATLHSCGFIDRTSLPNCVIPGYFEPFEPSNVTLDYAYKVFDGEPHAVILTRGDTDQDRPNRRPGSEESLK